VGLWDQIRDALSTVWADWHDSGEDERRRPISGLTEAWRAEQRLAGQIRLLIPLIPYEQFRRRLDVMAHDDEQHAALLQERLRGLEEKGKDVPKASEGSMSSIRSRPWPRLQQVLKEKRALFERYHQEANRADDAGLQSLLEKFCDDEERYQDELIEMLIHLDPHLHKTIN
jgi:hypothetical protein